MLSVLRYITKPGQVDYYIPSRFDEGYGLNVEAIRQIRQAGFSALLTVDCGSVSYEEVEYAKSLGMEVLVTDHHTITDKIADCLVINPKPVSYTHLMRKASRLFWSIIMKEVRRSKESNMRISGRS